MEKCSSSTSSSYKRLQVMFGFPFLEKSRRLFADLILEFSYSYCYSSSLVLSYSFVFSYSYRSYSSPLGKNQAAVNVSEVARQLEGLLESNKVDILNSSWTPDLAGDLAPGNLKNLLPRGGDDANVNVYVTSTFLLEKQKNY